MEEKVRYLEAIPAAGEVEAGRSLNVLGGAANLTDGPLPLSPALWGRAEGGWRCLERLEVVLAPGDHKHLYFNLPAACFLPGFWGEEAPEEVELTLSQEEPAPEKQGVLVFVRG